MQRKQNTYTLGNIRITTTEDSVVIDFGDGGHKRIEGNVDSLSGEKAFRCGVNLEIASLQAITEGYDGL